MNAVNGPAAARPILDAPTRLPASVDGGLRSLPGQRSAVLGTARHLNGPSLVDVELRIRRCPRGINVIGAIFEVPRAIEMQS